MPLPAACRTWQRLVHFLLKGGHMCDEFRFALSRARQRRRGNLEPFSKSLVSADPVVVASFGWRIGHTQPSCTA